MFCSTTSFHVTNYTIDTTTAKAIIDTLTPKYWKIATFEDLIHFHDFLKKWGNSAVFSFYILTILTIFLDKFKKIEIILQV